MKWVTKLDVKVAELNALRAINQLANKTLELLNFYEKHKNNLSKIDKIRVMNRVNRALAIAQIGMRCVEVLDE